MDFAVCPSCRQSVLDDDAVDCPFCGASMKAKPGAKPVAAAAKSPATASKPAAAKPGAAKQPTLPGDDLPFESELTTGKPAIPAMPSATKQRTWQVICPMCDTPGYLPPSAAGQNVRCANPKCVMPVFTAPIEKKKEAPPPPPPPTPSKLPMILGIAGLAVVLFLGGLYLALFPIGKAKVKKDLSPEDLEQLAELAGNKKTSGNPVSPTQPIKDPVMHAADKKAEQAEKVALATQDLINAALKQMKDSALATDKQRSKPYCRQLAAEANAVTGNTKVAREHLDQLILVGTDTTYYRIVPLLDLYWSEMAAGSKENAVKTLASAVSEVSKLPKFGRTRFEIVGRLVAAMANSGQIPQALEILSKFTSSDTEAQLAARLQRAMDGRVAPLEDTDSVLPWENPQAAAATFSLITRGSLATAHKWASAQPNDDAKAECLSVWAQELARQKAAPGEVDVDSAIATATEKLPPALAARVWARAGFGRIQAKDQAGAAKAIELAKEKLATISAPEEVTMPTIKSTIRYTKPTAEPLIQAATAAGELAFLQAQSAETKDDAEKSLDLALAYLRATAPTLAAAKQRQDEADRLGASLRDTLKKELNLKSDDEARTAANNYKRALGNLVNSAEQKFAIETQLLSSLRGAGVGLNSKVWIVVNTRSAADDINRRDNFFETDLPSELVEGLKGSDEARAILGAWGLRSRGSALPRPPFVEFNELLKSNIPQAVDYLQTIDNKSSRREEVLLKTTSFLSTTNQLPLAFQMIGRLEDLAAREECYRMACSLGAQRGQTEMVWNQVPAVQQQTEKVAICRGLIAGIQAAVESATATSGPR